MAEKRQLTGKQAKFIQEYLVDMNATAAAVRAGYSEKTAYSIGWELLRKPEIQDALSIARQELSSKSGITPEKVIEGFGHGAYYDPADLYDENMQLKNIHDIPKEARMALIGIDVQEITVGSGEDSRVIGQIKKVKFCDRHKNLESLAKHFGLYNADESQKPKGIRFEIVYEEKKKIEDGDN